MAKAKKSVKAINPSSRVYIKGLAVVIAIISLFILGRWLTDADQEVQKTVKVVRLKNAIGVSEIITENSLEPYNMYLGEFKQYGTFEIDGETKRAIVLWDERDQVVGNYASYYLREKTVLFWDSLVTSKENRNPYLYKMDNKELLKFEADAGLFGEILIPGDIINVRATYKETDFNLPPEELILLTDSYEAPTVTVSDMLFNEIVVVDMLNGGGESIFDVFYDLMSKPEVEQEKIITSTSFKDSITPKSFLFSLTAEEIEKYTLIKAKSPDYTITILPRTDSIILEYLADIAEKVKSLESDIVE